MYGDPTLFQVTKKLHNALQGELVELTEREVADYLRVNPWAWRCHIDTSNPRPAVWEMLKPFILRYAGVVVSSETFVKSNLPNVGGIPLQVIHGQTGCLVEPEDYAGATAQAANSCRIPSSVAGSGLRAASMCGSIF